MYITQCVVLPQSLMVFLLFVKGTIYLRNKCLLFKTSASLVGKLILSSCCQVITNFNQSINIYFWIIHIHVIGYVVTNLFFTIFLQWYIDQWYHQNFHQLEEREGARDLTVCRQLGVASRAQGFQFNDS